MNDKVKFYNMTKPIKFRKTRLFAKSVGRTYEVGTEKVKYLINNLLYKLNILKKHSYRDNVEEVLPIPYSYPERFVKSEFISGALVMKLKVNTFIHEEYFYKENKDRSKKITYLIKNDTKKTTTALFMLNNVHLKVGDRWFNVNYLPTFKYIKPVTEPVAFFGKEDSVDKPEVETITYNVAPIKNLRVEHLINADLDNDGITNEELNHIYDSTYKEFVDYLDTIKLTDLMI